MASFVASENYACINVDDYEFQGIEVPNEINTGFLMSLMEELQDQVEDGDEERLNSVIQSLEAEINSSTAEVDQVSHMESGDHQWISDRKDNQSYDLSQIDGQNWSDLLNEFDVIGWMKMESVMPCSPRHYMNLYMYPCGDEKSINDVIGFGVGLDLDHGYSSLWQETL